MKHQTPMTTNESNDLLTFYISRIVRQSIPSGPPMLKELTSEPVLKPDNIYVSVATKGFENVIDSYELALYARPRNNRECVYVGHDFSAAPNNWGIYIYTYTQHNTHAKTHTRAQMQMHIYATRTTCGRAQTSMNGRMACARACKSRHKHTFAAREHPHMDAQIHIALRRYKLTRAVKWNSATKGAYIPPCVFNRTPNRHRCAADAWPSGPCRSGGEQS
jgi:hypothetical protein